MLFRSIGGSNLPLAVAEEAVRRLRVRLTVGYGLTELCVHAASAGFRSAADLQWLIPAADRTIRIVGEDGRDCPPGRAGAVGISLIPGDFAYYFEDETATAKAFRDGFCFPGDLGVMRADGRLRLLGRDGDIVNMDGQKIPAALIEEQIQQALRVEEVCLFANALEWGQELVIALKTDREPPPHELAPLAREFETFERVRVAVLKEFPRTNSGTRKTSRPELRKLAFAAAREIGR